MKAKGALKKGTSLSQDDHSRPMLNNMAHAKEVLDKHYKKQMFGVDYEGMTKDE